MIIKCQFTEIYNEGFLLSRNLQGAQTRGVSTIMASGKMLGSGVCQVLGEHSKGMRGSAWAVEAAGRTRWKGGRHRARLVWPGHLGGNARLGTKKQRKDWRAGTRVQ